MTLFAELTMTPGGVFAWIVVGLLGGWLAGLAISGGGYGVIRDIFLGLIGASWAAWCQDSLFKAMPASGEAWPLRPSGPA